MKVKKGKKAAPVLLSGGNPQIPKCEGDAPVQAYIAAMPGWKRPLGERLDRLIVRPVPPKPSKHPEVRYLDIHEDDELDEAQLAGWIEQASHLPGETI